VCTHEHAGTHKSKSCSLPLGAPFPIITHCSLKELGHESQRVKKLASMLHLFSLFFDEGVLQYPIRAVQCVLFVQTNDWCNYKRIVKSCVLARSGTLVSTFHRHLALGLHSYNGGRPH
jgi:hypothetical protein